MKTPLNAEAELATGWPLSRVEDSLRAGDKKSLVVFLNLRYQERFLEPIRALRSAPRHGHGYGFAIMALCSLLVESLQCYRDGLPTSYAGEYAGLTAFNPPPEYQIPEQERKNGHKCFKDFFVFPIHQQLFPGVNGATFYNAIRNGLLHQAQTKHGWRIRTAQLQLWNAQDKVVDRDRFAEALTCAFDHYIEELNAAAWDSDVWLKARRKIWWVVMLSS